MLKNFFTIFNVKRSIFARLFVLLLAIFIFAFIIFTLLWHGSSSSLAYESYTSHISDMIARSNDKFDAELQNITSIVRTIADSENTILGCLSGFAENTVYDYSSYLNDILAMHSHTLSGISVLTEDGKFVTAGASYIPSYFAQTGWYQQIISARGRICYILKDSQEHSQKRLTIGCAVLDTRLPKPALVIAELSTSAYAAAFGVSNLGGAMRTVIFNEDNQLIFSNDSTLSTDAINQIIENSSILNSSGKLNEVSINGTNYLLSSQRSSYTGWINTSFFNKDIIDSEYRRVLNYTLSFVFLILILATIIAALISYAFSKRIHKLTAQIDSVNLDSLDDYEYDFSNDSLDEVGIISSKISAMMEKISGQFTEIKTLTEQKRLSDMEALKSQINPHFLYNALNAIDMLAKIHNDKPISDLTCSLISLLHYSIDTDNSFVTLNDELTYIKNYLEVMQTKFLDKINIIYDIEPGIEDCRTLRMILQPIVENCIKHAFAGITNKQIFIKAAHTGENVSITVIDNGCGAPPELNTQLQNGFIPGEGHLGLINVNKRIKLAFGEKYGLEILGIPNVQTTVTIKIPYIKTQIKGD